MIDARKFRSQPVPTYVWVFLVAAPLVLLGGSLLFGRRLTFAVFAGGLLLVAVALWACTTYRGVIAYRQGAISTAFGLVDREHQPVLFGLILAFLALVGPLLCAPSKIKCQVHA